MKIPKEVKKELMSIDGVVSVGLCRDGDKPIIRVEVLQGTKLPERAGGLKIRTEIVKEYPSPLHQETIASFQQRHRPVRPGLQIRNYGNGSIGFFIRHEGQDYLITAAHLLPSWEKGAGMWQESRGFNREIARLDRWVNIYDYPRGIGAPGDMMALKLLPDVPATNRFLDNKHLDFEPLAVVEPEIGMKTVRVGRTTGIRFDEIVEVDTSVRLQGIGDNPYWTCSNMFMMKHNSALPGDSGGGIFSLDPPGVLGVCAHPGGGSTATDTLEYLGFGRTPELVKNRETVVEIAIGSREMRVNGSTRELDMPPRIEDGRTLLELRGIGEVLGAKFDWEPKNSKTEKVYIYR